MPTMNINVPLDIGNALQHARLTKGMSQQELADALKIPQATVSQMESGQSTIYLRRLLAMARELDITLTAEWEG